MSGASPLPALPEPGAGPPAPGARTGDAIAARATLARLLARHAPRGAVRVAEALAATCLNRRRRAGEIWAGAFADAVPGFDEALAALPIQFASARADAAWNAVCRRIAARALAGAGSDPSQGAHHVLPHDAPEPIGAAGWDLVARIGPFCFYREPAPRGGR